MAIICAHCGKTLPDDGARFCRYCGTLLSPHSDRSPSREHVVPAEALSATVSEQSGPKLPEQVAHLVVPQRNPRRTSDDPPEWMNLLERDEREGRALRRMRMQRAPAQEDQPQQQIAAPVDSTSLVQEVQEFAPKPQSERLTTSDPNAVAEPVGGEPVETMPDAASAPDRTPPPARVRELRVKVWNEDDIPVSTVAFPPTTPSPDPSVPLEVERNRIEPVPSFETQPEQAAAREDGTPEPVEPPEEAARVPSTPAIDDMPTKAHQVVLPRVVTSDEQTLEDLPTRPLSAIPVNPVAERAIVNPVSQGQHQERVDHLDTVPMMAQLSSTPPARRSDVVVIRENTPFSSSVQSQETLLLQRDALTPLPPVPLQPEYQGMPPLTAEAAPASTPFPPGPGLRRRSPISATLTLGLLIVILIGAGIGYWLIAAQPFSVAPITNPVQGFQDRTLSIAVEYPHTWTAQIDRSTATVHLYDSSQTDQVDIAMQETATTDLARLLQDRAAHIGMTGTTTATPVTFAGSTWQYIHGIVQESGASYTEAIFATVHGNHTYILTQIAPQSTYNDEESITFAPLRSSLRFLA